MFARYTALGLSALVVALSWPGAVQAACSREDAFNKMMQVNQYSMKLQAALPHPLDNSDGYNTAYEHYREFIDRSVPIGKLLADEKYDEVCAITNALANDFNFSLEGQNVRTLSELENEAVMPPLNGCDLTQSSLRANWLSTTFQKHAEIEGLGDAGWRTFSEEMAPVGLMMQQDPAKACEMIDEIAQKYGFIEE